MTNLPYFDKLSVMKKYRLYSVIRKGFFTLLLAVAIAFTCFGCSQSGEVNDAEGPTENPGSQPEDDPSADDGNLQDPSAWAENFDLPDADTALSRLNEIYGGDD